jgi:hypothetical protein
LVIKANLDDTNSSNYVASTSNILVIKANLDDTNSSNYVASTSNILVIKANLNDTNTSNYVTSTSNILTIKANINDINSSNYVASTSNILITKANLNDTNTSNYIVFTSNILVIKANLNDTNSSNYVASTSNILVTKANINDTNSSNYVASTSNIISKRITDLNTDTINELPGAKNKFIINNIYNNNLEITGNLIFGGFGNEEIVNTPGIIDVARIPSLDTSKITTGTLSVARGGTGLSTITPGNILFGMGTSEIGNVSTLFYNNVTGRMGIGVSNPEFCLEIGAGGGTTSNISQRFFNVETALTLTTTTNVSVSVKVTGSIWVTTNFIASSDSRIKEDIQDINDDSALQMILAIEPKTYKYIDKIEKGDKKVYGFIAQQIKQFIPEATSIQKSYIPNIMLLADYDNYIIALPSQPNYIIKQNDKIKCYDKDNKEINIEVQEVIDELTFKIKELEYIENKIFVFGTEIDDFHTLDKNYIYTLNVCATQELHRKIKSQEERIKDLEEQKVIIQSQEDRIKALEAKITQILNNMSQ